MRKYSILTLVVSALIGLHSHASVDSTPDPQEPAPPVSQCQKIVTDLANVHSTLYDVDTRPLEIQQYKIFRDAITVLADSTDELEKFCENNNKGGPQIENLVTKNTLTWKYVNQYQNPCSLAQISSDELAAFAETAVRDCYDKGFKECSVKAKSRAYGLSSENTSEFKWTCSAIIDVVIEGLR